MDDFIRGERVVVDARLIGGKAACASESGEGLGWGTIGAAFFHGRRGTVLTTEPPTDLTGLGPAYEPRVNVRLDPPAELVVFSPIALRRLDAVELLGELT